MVAIASQITSLTIVSLNRLFRHRSKKTSKLRFTGLCAGTSPEDGEFPARMASNTENVSIWWRHHAKGRWCGDPFHVMTSLRGMLFLVTLFLFNLYIYIWIMDTNYGKCGWLGKQSIPRFIRGNGVLFWDKYVLYEIVRPEMLKTSIGSS